MRPERVIVLLKQFLGDGVMAEPLISALAATFSHVDVLAPAPVQQVLSHLDGKVSFVHMEHISGLRDTMEQARKIRRKQYDIAFLVNRSFRSAVLARLAKIPERVGHGTEGRSFLLTKSVEYSPDDFEAKSYADLASAIGVEVQRLHPRLQVTPDELVAGRKLADGATIAIQPGARHEYKRVPTEQLLAVASLLQGRGHKIALVGGSEEQEESAEFASRLDRAPVDLVGKTSIREMLGVLATMKLAIGSDTGVMHFAAGIGTPTVTVFGPTPVVKWSHRYAPHQVLQAPDGDLTRLSKEELAAAALRALDEA